MAQVEVLLEKKTAVKQKKCSVCFKFGQQRVAVVITVTGQKKLPAFRSHLF